MIQANKLYQKGVPFRGVDSGGVGDLEKGQSLISAYRNLAITASTSEFEKLSKELPSNTR